MDLRKKTNPFVENAKESEFIRAAARRQQQMTYSLPTRKTPAQRFKERYGRRFKEKYGIKGYIK